jgi:hypothetical protein
MERTPSSGKMHGRGGGGVCLSSLSQNCMSIVGTRVVSECYDKGDWYMDFRRTLTQVAAMQWEALVR